MNTKHLGYLPWLALAYLQANAQSPSVQFAYAPPPGTYGQVSITVSNVDNSEYRVGLIINVFGTFWTKPTWAYPLSVIPCSNCTFNLPFISGGQDACAQEIYAFIVPKDYAIPLLSGQGSIPAEIFANAITVSVTNRLEGASTLNFSGHNWRIKHTGDCIWGPGNNHFGSDMVWVDTNGYLHLRIVYTNGAWRCAEVYLTNTLGYGTYRFWLGNNVNSLPDPVVLGLFVYSDDAEYSHREIDIEFSNGAVVGRDNPWQNAIQPYYAYNQRQRFSMPTNMVESVHAFTWLPGVVSFRSYAASNYTFLRYSAGYKVHWRFGIPLNPEYIYSWTLDPFYVSGPTNLVVRDTSGGSTSLFYQARLHEIQEVTDPEPTHSHSITCGVPPSRNEKVRMNLWLHNAASPGPTNECYEVIIRKFEFIPLRPDDYRPELKVLHAEPWNTEIGFTVPGE